MASLSNKFLGTVLKLVEKKNFGQLLAVLLIGLCIYLLQFYAAPQEVNGGNLRVTVLPPDSVKVNRVIDGDTFAYLRDGEEVTVRLLGADTPETKDPRKPVQCFGEEASNYSNTLISGQTVRLESDAKANNLDKYGRELRYVHLPDGRMLNRVLIEGGYAHATPQYAFALKDEFVNLENRARMNGVGLWAPEACN